MKSHFPYMDTKCFIISATEACLLTVAVGSHLNWKDEERVLAILDIAPLTPLDSNVALQRTQRVKQKQAHCCITTLACRRMSQVPVQTAGFLKLQATCGQD